MYDELSVKFIIMLLCICAGYAFGAALSYNTCHAQWDRSGYGVEWGPIQGCMIEVKPNVWLPSKNLREIPLQDSK